MNFKMDKINEIQKEIGVMKKDTQGYNYKYFDINQLLEKLSPLLAEKELTLIQPLTNINGRPAINTRIYKKGDIEPIIDFTITLPDLIKPQDMGSCITYYRRYSLQSLFALEAEDDDAKDVQIGEKKVGKKEYQAKNKVDKENGADPLKDDDEI